MHSKLFILMIICLFTLRPIASLAHRTAAHASENTTSTGANTAPADAATPAVPEISVSGNLYALGTSYGTASNLTSFTLSAANLLGAITVTPPNGFEVSTDNINFTPTLTVGDASFTGPATIYLRLSPLSNAGDYGGPVVLSSNGAANVSINMPQSTVMPALINVYGYGSKPYGEPLTATVFDYTTPGFADAFTGFKNGNTFKSVKFSFGDGAAADAPVGTYYNSIILSEFEGQNGFLPGNYNITYSPGNLKILPAPLVITAKNASKPYGATLTANPNSTDFTVTGLVNNETVGYVNIDYGSGGPASAPAGQYPGTVTPNQAGGGTFSPGNYSISYKSGDLEVTALTPVITYAPQPAAMQTEYGTPSSSVTTRISGALLTGDITIVAPAGFEISLNNSNFAASVTLSPDATGTVSAAAIYIRLTALANSGNYNDNLTLTSAGAPNLTIPVTGTVTPAPLTITASTANKPFGTQLANDPASANFTATGLKNNETVGYVTISYGAGGAEASAPGTYTGSVTPSNAGGGSFSTGNYTITYNAGNIIVAPPAPAITYTANSGPLQTVYGTPSPALVINVSGTNLTGDITITAPNGFEMSTGSNVYSSTIVLTPNAAGEVNAVPIFIRLKATAPVANYTMPLSLASPGANSQNVALDGTVTPAPLTVAAKPVTKTYGVLAATNSVFTNFTASGLQNNETVSSVTFSYGAGAATTGHAGSYDGSVVPSAITGGTFNPANYQITYLPSTLIVNPAPLTIKADDQSRGFGKADPIFTVSYTGFVNNEGPAVLTTQPVVANTATPTSVPGKYALNVNGAQAADYTIDYRSGVLTIYPVSQDIKIYNSFTPNGDGSNDRWDITDLQFYPKCTVQVFNRYGDRLYFSRGYTQAWDGTYHGKALPAGVYYYVVAPNDGTPTKLSGYITLIK